MSVAQSSFGPCLCFTPSPMQFFQAYTGLQFTIRKQGDCKVYVPVYKNIYSTHIPNVSGTEMNFKDQYTSQTVLVGGHSSTIDAVTLSNLWKYANENVLWNDLTDQLSFQDIDIEEITLQEFVKNLDEFLVYNRLTKFGNVWWVGRVVTDLEGADSRTTNVTIPNVSGNGFGSGGVENTVKFWSPDKYVNDEYKKYISDPIFYTGFFTNADFTTNGWFTIPNMKMSTKPFEKLKIAQILLNLNFVFDPKQVGDYHTIDTTLGTRIKDETSDTILDVSETRGNQNRGSYAETIVNHWVGGLVSTENLTTLGPVGTFPANCTTEPITSATVISHSIAAQISLNTNTDSQAKELLNTIDPINWTSAEQPKNIQQIGILNTDRAFGGASGDATDGVVFGGIRKTEGQSPTVLDTLEIWSNTGFLKHVSTQANAPRSFHLQGGQGSKAAVVAGGYSDFNYSDVQQFSEYGKTTVRDDMEVFIKSDNPFISYFRQVPSIRFVSPRADGSGVLNVSVQDRQTKFDVENELQSFTTSKEDEQAVAEFAEGQAGTGNAKRFTIMNIDGFYYGGSKTGHSYMISNANGDISNSFERVSIIYASVGADVPVVFNGLCQETVVDVLSIDCKDPNGRVINIPKCGKYRIRYLNGAGRSGA